MKAFVFSDLHTNYKQLDNIRNYLVANDDIDLLIFAGDVVDMGEPVGYMMQFIEMIDKVKKPFFWVPGNNDFGRSYYKLAAKYPSLEGRVAVIPASFSVIPAQAGIHKKELDPRVKTEDDSFRFTGVGGSPASWAGQYQGESINEKINIGGTIFVSHVPPPGLISLRNEESPNPKKQIPDNNQNSNNQSSSRHFKDAPLVHICGHIHSRQGIGYLGQTKIVQIGAAERGNYAIMDLETLFVKFGRFENGHTY